MTEPLSTSRNVTSASRGTAKPKPTCHTCGASFNWGDKFCASCGKALVKKDSNEQRSNAGRGFNREGGQSAHNKEQDADMFKSLVKKNRKTLNSIGFALLGLAALAFLIHPFASAVLGILSLGAFLQNSALKQSQYYSIAGSKDANGGHRCIFCGNRGIYRHTIYKTTTTLNDCSKCGENLFKS